MRVPEPPSLPCPAAVAPLVELPPPREVCAPAPAIGSATTSVPTIPTTPVSPDSIAFGTVLLFEDFSHFREGAATDWGAGTYVKAGLDGRKWLVSNVDGAHPVGRALRLPNEFYLECRYSAYMPEATRGLLGWWREPVATRISLLDSRGGKYTIDWSIGHGSEKPPLNPLAAATVKHYHSVKLPGAAAHELGISPPTGVIRISRDKTVVNVLINGQLAASGMLPEGEQLVGFEIDVVKAKSGTLFFTDFKVGR